MITTTDIANIIYLKCSDLGIKRYQNGNTPRKRKEGGISGEMCVIHSKEQTQSRYWLNSYVEVNIFVPDNPDGSANLRRLNEIQRHAVSLFDYTAGIWDGTSYNFSLSSSAIVDKPDYKAHYVNCKILFKVININNK